MPTVDFLPFAVGAGANVETQPAYAAETALLANGFVAGVAPSAKFNKALRQSSIMATVLARFISENTGDSVIDDGSIATILNSLKSAVGGRPGHVYTANDWAWIDKPGGLILQWGAHNEASWTVATVTFPIAFPVSSFLTLCVENTTSVPHATSITPRSNAQVDIYIDGPPAEYTVAWVAIGF